MRQGLLAGGLGMVIGVGATTFLQKWTSSWLYQVRTFDTATLATAAAGILTILLFAVWIPSRRASRIDPQIALRHE